MITYELVKGYYYWDKDRQKYAASLVVGGESYVDYCTSLLGARNSCEFRASNCENGEIVVCQFYYNENKVREAEVLAERSQRVRVMEFWGVSSIDDPNSIRFVPAEYHVEYVRGQKLYYVRALDTLAAMETLYDARHELEIEINQRYTAERAKYDLPNATFVITTLTEKE